MTFSSFLKENYQLILGVFENKQKIWYIENKLTCDSKYYMYLSKKKGQGWGGSLNYYHLLRLYM
jgi:hypothetical protein